MLSRATILETFSADNLEQAAKLEVSAICVYTYETTPSSIVSEF